MGRNGREACCFFVCTLACACSAQVTGSLDASDLEASALDGTEERSSTQNDAFARRDVAQRERCNGLDDDRDGRIDEGCPVLVTQEPGEHLGASLSGSSLVWRCNDATCYRELPDGPLHRLPTSCAGASVSGQNLACVGPGNLYRVLDLTTQRERSITPALGNYYYPARLRGSLLSWMQIQNSEQEDYEVFVYDLEASRLLQFPRLPAIQKNPLVEGRNVAWLDDRLGHHTIGLLHLYDVFVSNLDEPRRERQLTHRAGAQQFGGLVAFDAGRILLHEYTLDPQGQWPVLSCKPLLLDATTGATRALAPDVLRCDVAHALSGRWAVLESDPLGPSDLYLVDTENGRRLRVTNHPRRSTNAVLDGNFLVWEDDRNERWTLYRMDLTDLEAGDFFPEGLPP